MKKISIVLTGKNDNYGGHFDERLILTTKYNVKMLKKNGFDVEIIFVEWNPIKNKELLSSKLVKNFQNVKCYVVREEEHNKIRTTHEYMTFLEFFAKNLGIQKSSGDIVLATNADVFYGKEVFESLGKIDIDDHRTIYRAERRDIRFRNLEGLSDEFFDKASFRTNPVGSKPYIDASGDFTMATKQAFLDLNGYDENINFVKIHKDSRFLFNALVKGYDFLLLGRIYHIDHEGSAVGTTGTLSNYRKTNGPYWWNYVRDLPYINPDHWGMQGENFLEEKIEENITYVSVIDEKKITFKNDDYLLNSKEKELNFSNDLKEFYKKYNLR